MNRFQVARRFRPVLVALLCLGCGGSGMPESDEYIHDTPGSLAANPGVGRVERWEDRLVVYPEGGTYWRQLIDLGLFDGLHPGISAEDARKRWGDPTSNGTRPLGPYWSYEREGGTVIVYLEEQGSPPFPYTKRWFLEGIPESPDPEDLFHSAVLGYLPEDEVTLMVVIMTNRGPPGARVRLEDGEVRLITWVN